VKRDLVIAGVAIAAVVGVSLIGHQPEGPKAATHASGDYSFGGYRAWYELLRAEGVDATRFRLHHDALRDSGIDTLIFAFPDDDLPSYWNSAERAALSAWVRAGGRLVDVGETPPVGSDDGDEDPVVLDDVRPDHGPLHGPWAAYVGTLGDRGTERLVRPKPARPPKRARGGKLIPAAVKKPRKRRPPVHVDTLLADRAGPLVVRYRYGRGEVIGVATGALFENRALGRADDARLAFLAAQPRPAGPKKRAIVAFDEAVRGDIVEKAWYRALDAPELVALALAALAGLLWLLYGIVPLGPAVRLRAAREPTSEEFLDAVAALYERARARDHARDALIAESRRALERAPRTAENVALAQRVAAAANEPLGNDAALLAVAKLARTAREEIIRGSNPEHRPGTFAGGARARRRRR
jgi:hypothetical protein